MESREQELNSMMVDLMRDVQEGGETVTQRFVEDATNLDCLKRACLYLMRRLCGPGGTNPLDE